MFKVRVWARRVRGKGGGEMVMVRREELLLGTRRDHEPAAERSSSGGVPPSRRLHLGCSSRAQLTGRQWAGRLRGGGGRVSFVYEGGGGTGHGGSVRPSRVGLWQLARRLTTASGRAAASRKRLAEGADGEGAGRKQGISERQAGRGVRVACEGQGGSGGGDELLWGRHCEQLLMAWGAQLTWRAQ